MKKEKNDEKYYVVRPIRESIFDDEYRVIGTKDEIAEMLKEQIEDNFESRELKWKPTTRERLFSVEFHHGSSDGKEGHGSFTTCRTLKNVKEWMTKQMKEIRIDAPTCVRFDVFPIYWVSKDKKRLE